MSIRQFLVFAFFLGLLIWGPIDQSSPIGLWVRLAYLFVAPALAWVALDWTWRYWRPTKQAEDRLMRTLAGAVAAAFAVGAILEAALSANIGETPSSPIIRV
ncbi:MAG: hypothetical protein IMZ71_01965 [Chloroflexi bacterium]|nr:hypothetical protein [Chloroflexota bacterium]